MNEPLDKPRKSSVFPVLALAVASLLGFLAIAWWVSGGASASFDERVLLSLRSIDGQPLGPLWFRETVADYTALGGYPVMGLVVLFIIGLLWILQQREAIVFLVASVVSGSIVSTVLKWVFTRERPDLVEQLDQTFTSSFPSAHAMLSMLVWLTLAAVLIRFMTDRRIRRFVLASAVGLSLLIGISRVYLGVHWPSDVLAGWLAGLMWASLCWLIAHALTRRSDRVGRFGQSAV